jgi:hypothetical protein
MGKRWSGRSRESARNIASKLLVIFDGIAQFESYLEKSLECIALRPLSFLTLPSEQQDQRGRKSPNSARSSWGTQVYREWSDTV